MAKLLVLKRIAHQIKDENDQLVSGEMVEFVQIPDRGPAQVQVYFVPSDKTDAEILGVSAQHHEDELRMNGIGFSGPQAQLDGAESIPETLKQVTVTGEGEVTVEEVTPSR